MKSGFAPALLLLASVAVACSAFVVPSAVSQSSSTQLSYIGSSTSYRHQNQQQQPYYKNTIYALEELTSEQAILQHYTEWCTKFSRKPTHFRFLVFQRNYLCQFKWNLAAGKSCFTLNEYADCTEEEYLRIMKQAAKNVVPPNAHHQHHPAMEEGAKQATVVVDEDEQQQYTIPGNPQRPFLIMIILMWKLSNIILIWDID